ncbi:MAG: histidine kinase [Ginsengibacter sp.]
MHKIILILSLFLFSNIGFAQKLEMQLDSINPVIKNDSHGDSIRKYLSTTFYGSFYKKDSLLINSFYSNRLAVNYSYALEKIPQLKRYQNHGNLYMTMADSYPGKYAIPIFDSSGIIITVNGINQENVNEYQFRVLQDSTKIVLPWTNIKLFCNSYWMTKIANPNKEDTVTAYLGQFKDVFGKALTFQVRKKSQPDFIQASLSALWVKWHPRVVGVFNFTQLPDFLKIFKKQWVTSGLVKNEDWSKDSTLLQLKHKFQPNENSLIFYLDDIINSRKIIEYNLVNGNYSTGWKINDFDFNIIWLKNLLPGNYQLKIRYSVQRQNVYVYSFTVKAAWYQTFWFKLGLIILGLLVISFILLLLRSGSQSRKIKLQDIQKQIVQTELKSIRSQFNPHFVFNALNSIQGLMTKNDPENASKYLIEFSELMRDSLKAGNNEFTSISREMKMLENYLNLEKLRFGFHYQMDVDKNIDTNAVEIPGMLLQPLVENAVKHGISALQDKGILMISFKKSDNDMFVYVKDNGKGFQERGTEKGYGLQLTKERIKLLNKTLNQQEIEFFITRLNDETQIKIHFKNWLL